MALAERTVLARRAAPTRALGFTLLELMVTITVAAMVLGLGVPSFVDLIRNNRAATNVNELLTAFSIARSESIKRGSERECLSQLGRCRPAPALGPTVGSCFATMLQPTRQLLSSATSCVSGPKCRATQRLRLSCNGTPTDIGWVRFAPRGAVRTAGAMPTPLRHHNSQAARACRCARVELNTVGRASCDEGGVLTMSGKPPHASAGGRFLLIEVLVALVVLSVGLLGLAALQQNAVRFNHDAYLRSQATVLAYDIADRIRGNRQAATDEAYDSAFSKRRPRRAMRRRRWDGRDARIGAWRRALTCALPAGNGQIDWDDVQRDPDDHGAMGPEPRRRLFTPPRPNNS